ncbi:hypothetical protein [Streptomyces sp. NPDC053048]|uniref:hypothetical protein n=1 Tax=Streptomyces sp. NPDC053048 TaxID=3365694 RepID=UPI0037D51515
MISAAMWKRSATAVVVNLLLGIPGVVPVWLLWYFAVNWPLAAIGWSDPEPTENDGTLPGLLVGVLLLGLFVLWWLINRSVRRRTTLDARLYWPVSAVATLVPTFVLMVVL